MVTLEISPTSTISRKNSFKSTVELFEDQLQRDPNAVAISFKDMVLTYNELDQKSNQLAKYLRANGVQTGSYVGLSLSNNFDLIISILGILKAGGVYVPLEPSYPKDRINYMLEDAKPLVLLTESQNPHQFESFTEKKIVLDRSWEEITTFDSTPLGVSINSKDLAYVIYTSGSTGKPKGIMVDHGSFAYACVAHREFYQEKLVGLMSGAISFDVSILIIFHSLTSGGRIHIPPLESRIDPAQLIDVINSNSINYILCVPSLYSMILNRSQKLPSLKIVSLTGENIPNSILLLHPYIAPNAILYNEYGPTEYAIGTTIAKIYDPKLKITYPVSVGNPLPGTFVYIFDEKLQALPAGAKGEIYIGGPGIARGYLNMPNLTAEKFITFRNEIIYRTGDFGRFLPNGTLKFLGRIDNQVKIRGNRIELAEIEQEICRLHNINEAVVVCEGTNENRHLVAYFTAIENKELGKEIKSHLTNLLPKYMIPSKFIQLQAFPRTPNGKIDRNLLPTIVKNKNHKAGEPITKLEQSLLNIWKKILHLKMIGSQDNFFDLGGDSFALAVVQTQIESDLAIKVPITDLLQYPTIAQLALHLNNQPNNKIVSTYQDLSLKRRTAFNQYKSRAKR
jgi:amino acid adenylation domain-containing protein